MVTGAMQRRRVAWLVAVVGLLLGVGAGVGPADRADQSPGRAPAAVVSAGGAFGAAPAGAPDSRLLRPTDAGPGQRISDHLGLNGVLAHGHNPAPVVSALAAVLERAGHPERLGQILLRGPPGPSA